MAASAADIKDPANENDGGASAMNVSRMIEVGHTRRVVLVRALALASRGRTACLELHHRRDGLAPASRNMLNALADLS